MNPNRMTLLEKFKSLGYEANPKIGYVGHSIADMTKEELMIAYTKLWEHFERETDGYSQEIIKLLQK